MTRGRRSKTVSWGRVLPILLLVVALAQFLPFAGVGGVATASGPRDRPTIEPDANGGVIFERDRGRPGDPGLEVAEPTRVLPQLLTEARANPDQRFRVIISRSGNDRKADYSATLLGGKKLKELRTDGAFVAELPGRVIERLSRLDSVRYIAIDAPMMKTDVVESSNLGNVYAQAVGASQLWMASVPYTGKGVGVAVFDTGISPLADFNNASGSSRIVANAVFNQGGVNADDKNGHGTHVAGIIAGNSWHRGTSAVRGRYIGIAPEANLINVRVSNNQGMSYVSDVVDAIEWVIANRETYNIRVMNLSLVAAVPESYTTSVLAAAVERAWFNGIFVVVSAGNMGPDTLYYPPANDPFVVTVGAADPLGTTNPLDDNIAPWSSYGTSQDGVTKPEVVAPGRYMASTLASRGATLANLFPERIVDQDYIWMSGTSMASPVVAGVAALAFEAHPEWTNDQVKWLLANTANPLSGVLPEAQGAGQVDAPEVVLYEGTPDFANQGLTLNLHLETENGETTYSSASWSTASWSTASWSTASWSTASWSTASWSTVNWGSATWSTATERWVE